MQSLSMHPARPQLAELARWFGWPLIAVPVAVFIEGLAIGLMRLVDGPLGIDTGFTLTGGAGDCMGVGNLGGIVAVCGILVFCAVMTERMGPRPLWASVVLAGVFRYGPFSALILSIPEGWRFIPSALQSLLHSAFLWVQLVGLLALLATWWVLTRAPRPRSALLLATALGTVASLALLSLVINSTYLFAGDWMTAAILRMNRFWPPD